VTAGTVYQATRARSLIRIAATTALAGIGLAATGDAGLGALFTLPSLILLIYGLHRFGRSGPDEI
jgi:hypothetical protein